MACDVSPVAMFVANSGMVAHPWPMAELRMEKFSSQLVGSDFAGLRDLNLSIPIKIPHSQAQAIKGNCEDRKSMSSVRLEVHIRVFSILACQPARKEMKHNVIEK